MSVKTINDIILTFCLKMKTDVNSVIIKTIEIEHNSSYIMRLELNDELYSIEHYEPINMIQGVNYGNGPYHLYHIFDKKHKIFTRLNNPF
jgi:hypothetical protein